MTDFDLWLSKPADDYPIGDSCDFCGCETIYDGECSNDACESHVQCEGCGCTAADEKVLYQIPDDIDYYCRECLLDYEIKYSERIDRSEYEMVDHSQPAYRKSKRFKKKVVA